MHLAQKISFLRKHNETLPCVLFSRLSVTQESSVFFRVLIGSNRISTFFACRICLVSRSALLCVSVSWSLALLTLAISSAASSGKVGIVLLFSLLYRRFPLYLLRRSVHVASTIAFYVSEVLRFGMFGVRETSGVLLFDFCVLFGERIKEY